MTARTIAFFLLAALTVAAATDEWSKLMGEARELAGKGRFTAADAIYARAAVAAADSPTPELSRSVTTIAIGRLRFEEGRLKDAESIWKAELARLEMSALPTLPALLLHLGDVLLAQRRYSDAEEVLVRCARMKKSASTDTRMTALAGLGAVYGWLSRYAEAATVLEEARAMAADGGLDSAVIEHKLAVVYSRLGRNAEADELFECSLREARQHLGAADPRLALPMTVFAEHLQRTGRKQRAKELRRSAKQLQAESVDARRHTIDIRSLRGELGNESR